MSAASHRLLALLLGIVVLALDIASKSAVSSHIPLMNPYTMWYPYGGIGVFKDFLGVEFSIVYTVNKGAAWGILADYQHPLLWLRMGLILALLIYVFFFKSAQKWLFPLTLILAGAIGNVIDYFIYGHVVDLFHFILWGYDFPVFNVADSAICIGVFWLAISSLLDTKSSSQPSKN
jgi:signal peptidase II